MVLALVGDDERRRVGGVALHMLPGGAAAHRAALVVAKCNALVEQRGRRKTSGKKRTEGDL